MKSYTDIEQSKKLAEILPIESADMCLNVSVRKNMPPLMTPYSRFDEFFNMGPTPDFLIPCWSLAALIEALPLGLEINNISDGHKIYYYVEMYTKEIYMKLKRMNKPEICLSTERHENLVDACVEMILKLKQRNLL